MKILRIIFLCITCAAFLSAAVTDKNAKGILKEFDIDSKFLTSAHYKSIKNDIKESRKREFIRAVESGYRHIPVLQKIIKESGIPESFLFLAMVESGFSNNVVSSVKATGIWQFMAPTAKIYGLRIDKYTDERRDPVAATVAATKYLKSLKKDFGKWYLAMMAYNCGGGRLKSAIKKAGTDDINVLLDSKKGYLPAETRAFVKKILTLSHIAADKEFVASKSPSLLKTKNTVELVKVTVPGGTTLMEVGDSIGISLKRMKENNTHLNFVYTPPMDTPYYVYIPKNKEGMFNDNFESLQNRKFEIYTVQKSDTLFDIAQKTGVDHKIIKEYNGLASNTLKPNQSIVIPIEQNTNYLAEYIVKSGDSLSEVSTKFDVALEDLKEANNLISSNLSIGAKLASSE